MGNEEEVKTSRLILRWVRNSKTRPVRPFGFNQADRRFSLFSVLGRAVGLSSLGNNLHDSGLLDVNDHP